jgi:hypothetical protein
VFARRQAPCDDAASERTFLKWQWPWMPEDWKGTLKASPWLRMFQNARAWCDENPARGFTAGQPSVQ